jgi:hypothetical protein
MHHGQRSYSIYNNQVYSLIFYSDEFLSFKKHFHIHDNQNHINAFRNTTYVRVFLSKSCQTTLDFQKTSKTKQLIFQNEKKKCPRSYYYVGALYVCQICKSQSRDYPFYVILDSKPLPDIINNLK